MLRLTIILIVCTALGYGQAGSMSELKIESPNGRTRAGLSVSKTIVHELIGLSGDKHVELIAIGRESYGRGLNFERSKSNISLGNDEYISSVTFKSSDQVDYLKFCTNKNRCVEAGSEDGTYDGKIENVRVLAISCDTGRYIYNLGIMYIPNYEPSQSVSKNVSLVLAYSPPSSKVEEYTADTDRVADSYIKTIEYMARMNFDTSVEGEYIVKIHSQFGYIVTYPNLQDYKQIIKEDLLKDKSKKQSVHVPESYVGVLLANGELMKKGSGTFWMMPTSVPTFSVIKLSEVENLLGYYDLTGDLFKQMPNLKPFKTIKNGHIYYDRSHPLDILTAIN